MSATEKVWVNGQPPQLEDDDLNGFKTENNNLITTSGQVLNISNNNQTTRAVSIYGSGSDFYTGSGPVNAYVLSPKGSKLAPPAYFDGMKVRFIALLTNTGGSTVNVAGIGVKTIKKSDFTDVTAGNIVGGDGNVTELTYDLAGNIFYISTINSGTLLESIPDATKSNKGLVEIADDAEVTAGTSEVLALSPSNLKEHDFAAKIWMNADGDFPGPSIRKSRGISSFVRDSAGRYTINFTNAFADANFIATGNCDEVDEPDSKNFVSVRSQSTTFLSVNCLNDAGTFSDANILNIVIFDGA